MGKNDEETNVGKSSELFRQLENEREQLNSCASKRLRKKESLSDKRVLQLSMKIDEIINLIMDNTKLKKG